MAEAAFLIPGNIDTPTGGYGYDRRVLALLPAHGVRVNHVALPGDYPAPGPEDLERAVAIFSRLPQDQVLLFDGLAYGVMAPSLLGACRGPILALVHHPLFMEAGLSPERKASLFESERAALGLARAVIATSASTAEILVREFGLAAEAVTVAEPGTDPAERTRGGGSPLKLLAVGAIVPRKGYDLLVEALKPLRDLEWKLDIIGAPDRDRACAEALVRAIALAGLGDRIRLLGAVDDGQLGQAYGEADIFVMSSLFEGYGMVLGEAMARGLPIVCTTGGACAETVPDGAALKVSPGDVGELSRALSLVIGDGALRSRLGNGSWEAGRVLPRWTDTARTIATVIERVGHERF